MRTAVVIVASVIAFLVAAKLHGMQLRLEREAQGITHVVFGGQNPPFVEELWHAERWRFWGLTLGLALVVGVAGLWLVRARGAMVAIAVVLWVPTFSFLVTGGMSAWRRGRAAAPASR